MSNRKATFAKRQRETDLKDHARQKAERKEQRRSQQQISKGPQIDWGQAIDTSNTKVDDVVPAGAPAARGDAMAAERAADRAATAPAPTAPAPSAPAPSRPSAPASSRPPASSSSRPPRR